MLIGYFAKYKALTGTICLTDGKHHGRILSIRDHVDYRANSLEELEKEFRKAVDDYLEIKASLQENTNG